VFERTINPSPPFGVTETFWMVLPACRLSKSILRSGWPASMPESLMAIETPRPE
jgi:hypothetical protein